MVATDLFARRATLSRSVRLLSAFRFEQRDPDRFYGAVADDTVAMVGDLWTSVTGTEARGTTLVDVGGGPGYFASAFTDAGVRYIGVEPDPREMHAGVLSGRQQQLPQLRAATPGRCAEEIRPARQYQPHQTHDLGMY